MSVFPTRILLATDGSKEATLAARTAADIAQKTDSELDVVYVGPSLEYVGMGPPQIADIPAPTQEQLSAEARELLEAEVEQVKGAGRTVAQAHLRLGAPAQEIVDLAEKLSAGLVVIGSRGRGGIRRALMGSISDSVVRHAHCPVLIVRGEENGEPVFPLRKRILLATDGSEEGELALQTAVDLANSTNSELHVVTVGLPDLPDYVELLEEAYRRLEREAQQTLEEQVKKIEEAGGIIAKAHLVMEGPPAHEIVRLSEELSAGLVVMGSRGLGGMRRALLGSVSDSVIHHAHCPVLIIRREDRG